MEWAPRYLPREEFISDLLTTLLVRETKSHLRLKGFKCPILASYKGIRDLKNHVLNFKTYIALHIDKDHILCKPSPLPYMAVYSSGLLTYPYAPSLPSMTKPKGLWQVLSKES